MSSCKTAKSTRKGPKRPPPKELIDDDMSELALVLAEYRLDNNAEGWFKLPWRDGWNAVELALRAAQHDLCPVESARWTFEMCAARRTDPDVYWTADELLACPTTRNPTERAGLRCLQILNAKSDGGGEVYNAVLMRPLSRLLPELIEGLVLEYRCRDSIGVGAKLLGDDNDRLRRAFTIAWRRGLYAAAYSLPAATVKGQLRATKGEG